MKKTKINFKMSDFIIGFIFTLLIIALAVVFILNFKPLYYFDIDYLNIADSSGYDKELIKRNYDALIEYNSPFFKGDLEFPDLPSSPQGLQHFVEVKDIFSAFYYIGIVSLIASVLIIVYKSRKKDHNYLLTSSISVVIIPIIVGMFAAIDFDKAFVVFHNIFFRNNYWIFSPSQDPVIKILPQTFFLHCLILIIVFIIIASLILFASYNLLTRSKSNSLL